MQFHDNVQKIQQYWAANFTEQLQFVVKSPGRINLIGEHTDYNDGYALPAAINLGIYSAISKTDSTLQYEVVALDKAEVLLYNLENETLFPSNSWQNYIIGVVQELRKVVGEIGGFRFIFFGDIPQGAGLSSSAALENALVFSLNKLFDLKLSKEEMILISQRAEHHFVGVQCGLMDQLSSMFGQENKILKVDFLQDKFELINFELNDYELVLINSNVTHQLASSEYNNRRKDCESAMKKMQLKFPEIKSFRDVNESILKECILDLNTQEFKRVKYILEEENRVLKCVDCLKTNAFNLLGELLFEGHQGIKNLYEITCPETDFLVEKAQENKHVIGARQMGGGFGGCTINLVEKGKINQFYNDDLQAEYKNKFNKNLSIIPVEIANGTEIIWEHE